jgi:asparagine synthase (glutamine-hydrolysing)
MKGVFGLADYRDYSRGITEALASMGEMMTHMPWHQVDIYADEAERVGLGRLGIGMLNSGDQPLFSEDKNVILCMVGEFYNRQQIHLEMKKQGIRLREGSDEELALSLYLLEGREFVRELEGIFLIAIWDRREEKLRLFNDRFGLYPCYISHTKDQFIFAPSANCVSESTYQIKALDLIGLSQYLRFQHMLGDRTFFEDVHLLPHAVMLEYNLKTGTLIKENYWSLEEIPPIRQDISFDEAASEAGRLMRKAVTKRYNDSHLPVGLYLSGGLDSRTILGMIDKENRAEVNSITFGKQDSRDVYYAKRVAKRMGTRHHWFDLPDGKWILDFVDLHLALTEGFHSWIHAHGISSLEAARDLFRVNLSGLGGGMIMAGGDIHPALVNAPDDIAWMAGLFHVMNQKNTWPSITEAEEQLLYFPEFYNSYIKGRAFESFREEALKAQVYDKQTRTEFFIWEHCDRRLFQMYTVFFGAYLENRYPYFDYELFDFLFSLPLEYRQDHRLTSAVLQKEAPSLSLIPYERDERLPTTNALIRNTHAMWTRGRKKILSTLNRNYRGRPTLYADYENYLRSDLKVWATNLLLDRNTLDREFFQPQSIASLLDRHLAGHEEWTIGKIAPIMTFELVMRKFFDKVLAI